MQRIALIGAGALGIQIAHFVTTSQAAKIVGYFDDYSTGHAANGLPILGTLAEIEKKQDLFDQLFISIGYNHLQFKDDLYQELKNKYPFFTFVHPSAIVDSSAEIGEGSAIYAGCIIDMNVKISDNTVLNNGVVISHDSQIGVSAFLAPGVVVSGNCQIGSKCFIGANSTIRDGIDINNDIIIGAHSYVNKNLDSPGTYVGSPATRVQ